MESAQPVLGGRTQNEFGLGEVDLGFGPFEVESGPGLAVGLIDRVADLLHVNLGHDVERRHAGHPSHPDSGAACPGAGGLRGEVRPRYRLAPRVGARVAKGSRL